MAQRISVKNSVFLLAIVATPIDRAHYAYASAADIVVCARALASCVSVSVVNNVLLMMQIHARLTCRVCALEL